MIPAVQHKLLTRRRRSLVSQGKVKQLLAGAWETKFTGKFPQLSGHLAVTLAVRPGSIRLWVFH
jgi:hypothetical protein